MLGEAEAVSCVKSRTALTMQDDLMGGMWPWERCALLLPPVGEVRVHGREEMDAALVGSSPRRRSSQPQSRLTAPASSLRAEMQAPGVVIYLEVTAPLCSACMLTDRSSSWKGHFGVTRIMKYHLDEIMTV